MQPGDVRRQQAVLAQGAQVVGRQPHPPGQVAQVNNWQEAAAGQTVWGMTMQIGQHASQGVGCQRRQSGYNRARSSGGHVHGQRCYYGHLALSTR